MKRPAPDSVAAMNKAKAGVRLSSAIWRSVTTRVIWSPGTTTRRLPTGIQRRLAIVTAAVAGEEQCVTALRAGPECASGFTRCLVTGENQCDVLYASSSKNDHFCAVLIARRTARVD